MKKAASVFQNPKGVKCGCDDIHLIGIGIICGFDVFMDHHCNISVSEGIGVTSAGTIICQDAKEYKYYCHYHDPNQYFDQLFSHTCELYELGADYQNAWTPLTPQVILPDDAPHFLDDKIVLLYNESPDNLKTLLVARKYLDELLLAKDQIVVQSSVKKRSTKKDVSIFDFDGSEETSGEEMYEIIQSNNKFTGIVLPRFGYCHHSDEGEDCTPSDLIDKFYLNSNTFKGIYEAYACIIEEGLAQLEDALEKLHQQHEAHFRPHNIKYVNYYFDFLLKKWVDYKKHALEECDPEYAGKKYYSGQIQYFYDFVHDLVRTLNEIKALLCELMAECCLDVDAFPQHLMLGKVNTASVFQPSVYRHTFLQPPIYNGNRNRLEQIQLLHWRLVIMIKCFHIPGVEFDDTSDDHYALKANFGNTAVIPEDLPIRITPSRHFREVLGRQAIPFYYHLSNSTYSLQRYWEYMAWKHGEDDQHLAYHALDNDTYATNDFVLHPFSYDICPYPFYRIEGHLCKSLNDVYNVICDLKCEYNLSFDVVHISIQSLVKEPDYFLKEALWGIKHIAGVVEGGTFVLVHDDNLPQTVIADFYLPFLCCEDISIVEKEIVCGCVIDCVSKEPIPGAEVLFSEGVSVVTDEDGKFEVSLVSPANYTVTIEKDGYVLYNQVIVINKPGNTECLEEDLLIFELTPAFGDVTLCFEYSGGIPAGGIVVIIKDSDPLISGTTDLDGKITFPNLPNGPIVFHALGCDFEIIVNHCENEIPPIVFDFEAPVPVDDFIAPAYYKEMKMQRKLAAKREAIAFFQRRFAAYKVSLEELRTTIPLTELFYSIDRLMEDKLTFKNISTWVNEIIDILTVITDATPPSTEDNFRDYGKLIETIIGLVMDRVILQKPKLTKTELKNLFEGMEVFDVYQTNLEIKLAEYKYKTPNYLPGFYQNLQLP